MKRENRYLVLKRKDIDKYLSPDQIEALSHIDDDIRIGRIEDTKKRLLCVVVEHDWPEYEKVWEMIEERVDEI